MPRASCEGRASSKVRETAPRLPAGQVKGAEAMNGLSVAPSDNASKDELFSRCVFFRGDPMLGG